MNIEFSRLPPEDAAVFKAYAPGSGISATGRRPYSRYIVTNRVRGGEALDGVLRTSIAPSGDYIVRVITLRTSGNRTTGPSTELAITVKN